VRFFLLVPVLLGLAFVPRPAPASEVPGDDHAFVEVIAERSSFFVQEPIGVVLRVGYDAEFFATSSIQLFRQSLDVPIQVRAPWLRELPGTIALEAAPDDPGASLLSLALGDGMGVARRVPDVERYGRPFAVVEIERTFLPLLPGELVIDAPVARFAFATRFEQDFISGRIPVDRKDAFVRGMSVTVTVVELPGEGRPSSFTGAVGRFAIAAARRPGEVAVGEVVQLVLSIEGEGNLHHFSPPVLESLPGFHVYGLIDEKEAGLRRITYDLAPLDVDVTAIPAIAFATFDTDEKRYRTLHTEPLPLTVRSLAGGSRPLRSGEGARGEPGVDDIYGLEEVSGRAGALPSTPLLLAGMVLPWVLALGVFVLKRSRERDRRDPEGVRARGAILAFRRGMAEGGEVAQVLAEYLSARLRCPPAAVIGPDLGPRLRDAGVERALADDVARLLRELVAASYGSGASLDGAREEALRIAEQLEVSLAGREESP